MTQLTITDLQNAVPAALKRSVSQDTVDTLNSLAVDPFIAESIRENFFYYTGVLKDGKFKTTDYLSAIMYVSFKLMGDSNLEAWCKTFPQRYALLCANGAEPKTISAHVSAYNKGQLVNRILEQSMVPIYVLNQDAVQKAINVQVDLMNSATSEKVRSDAANSILTHLKKPDVIKGQIDINMNDSSGMNELKDALGALAEQQRKMIESGVGIRQITDSKIIENDDGRTD